MLCRPAETAWSVQCAQYCWVGVGAFAARDFVGEGSKFAFAGV